MTEGSRKVLTGPIDLHLFVRVRMDPGEIWRVREGLCVSRRFPKGPVGSRRVKKYIMDLHLSGMVLIGPGGSMRIQEGVVRFGRVEEALVGLFESGRV